MQFQPVPNAFYAIQPAYSNQLCLDRCSNAHSFNKIHLYQKNGGKHQQFAIFRNQDGSFSFFCAINNGVLKVQNGSQIDGEGIEIGQPRNVPNEKWIIVPVPNTQKTYFIRASYNGKALDVCEGNFANDSPIIQWQFHGGQNQQWVIERVA